MRQLRRSLLRGLCTWFTCVLVGVVAVPSGSVSARGGAAAEVVVETLRQDDEQGSVERAVSAVQCAQSGRADSPMAWLEPSPAWRRLTLHEHAVVSPLYLEHCAFLI